MAKIQKKSLHFDTALFDFLLDGPRRNVLPIPNYQDLPTNYQQPASNFLRRRANRFTQLRGSVRLVPAPIPPAGPKNKKREAVVAPLSFHITRKNYLCEMLTL